MSTNPIRIDINTAQLDELVDRLRTAPAEIRKRTDQIVKAEADELLYRIVQRWPIKTGYSIARWVVFREAFAAWVVTNRAGYAGWVFAKGDGSRTPLLYTWIAVEVARTRIAILAGLRRMLVEALRAPRGGSAVRGGRITMGRV